MNYGPLLFLGIFLTLASSWVGLTLIPQLQYGGLQTAKAEETSGEYPLGTWGAAAKGREVYRVNGCIYCHSQQVRPQGFGADIERGWGARRSVSRDYLHDKPVLLGTMRTVPSRDRTWRNKPAAVPVEDVKIIREKTKDRASQPWVAELLKAVPETE